MDQFVGLNVVCLTNDGIATVGNLTERKSKRIVIKNEEGIQYIPEQQIISIAPVRPIFGLIIGGKK